MMNYEQMINIFSGDIDTEELQADTITICVDGKYFPARIVWHANDVVEQYVLEIDDDT